MILLFFLCRYVRTYQLKIVVISVQMMMVSL